MSEDVQHISTYAQASMEGYSVACRCGWSSTVRFARMIHLETARREMAGHMADHAKHMALVHVAKTHGFANCGRLCIYDRKAMEAEHAAAHPGGIGEHQ